MLVLVCLFPASDFYLEWLEKYHHIGEKLKMILHSLKFQLGKQELSVIVLRSILRKNNWFSLV